MKHKSNEQKLVDIIFEVAQISAYHFGCNEKTYFSKKREEHMEWVAKQLRDCGFNTTPSGSSWGVLIKNEE